MRPDLLLVRGRGYYSPRNGHWWLGAQAAAESGAGDQRDLPSAFSLAITEVITHASLVEGERGIDFRRFFSRLQFCLIH